VPSDEAIIAQDISTTETVVRNMKNGKAAGVDSITVEMLKADADTTTNVLHELFQNIWD